MVYQKYNIITESERNRILGLYNVNSQSQYVILDWLSPDENYSIFLDELYDIKTKTNLGNIWENFDNFKFFIKHSFDVAKNIPIEIKESVNTSLKNLILTESTQDFSKLKPFIKEYLINEGLLDWAKNAGTWLKDTTVNAAKGFGDFVSKSFDGIKNVVKGITSGEWTDVLNLLKKGVLWVARKIRGALYNPIGLILDAILVATGIGKAAQVILWGIVVGLDIYELMSGNYEDKDENFLMRLLFTGIDIIALISVGGVAKAGKTLFQSLFRKFGTSTEGLVKAAKSNSMFKGLLEKMMSAAQSASSKMGEVAKYLETKSPMLYKFISGILNFVGKFAQKIIVTVKGILGIGNKIEKALGGGGVIAKNGKLTAKQKLGAGGKALFNTGAVVGGVGTYGQMKKSREEDEMLNALQNSDVTPDYSDLKI